MLFPIVTLYKTLVQLLKLKDSNPLGIWPNDDAHFEAESFAKYLPKISVYQDFLFGSEALYREDLTASGVSFQD